MGKMNIFSNGLVCLGRYQRFDDLNESPEYSYNCSRCGHVGKAKSEDVRTYGDGPSRLNNESVSSPEKVLQKNSINCVVNDLGLKKSNTSDKNVIVKKLLRLRREDEVMRYGDLLQKEEWSSGVDYDLVNAPWYHPGFDRDSTVQYLSSLSTGSFVVRRSKSRRDALALSVKTGNGRNINNKIVHFLILVLPNGSGFRIKGSKKTFSSLRSLIIHHSVMSEVLPCPLLLPELIGGSEDVSENSEMEEDEEDVADISNYPDLLFALRRTFYEGN